MGTQTRWRCSWPPSPRATAATDALGYWGAVGSAGPIVGQLLGGVLTTAFGWRSGLAVVILTLPCVADGTSLTSVIVIAQLKAGPSSLSTSTIRVCSGGDVHTLDAWRSARCHSQPMTVPVAATDLGREP